MRIARVAYELEEMSLPPAPLGQPQRREVFRLLDGELYPLLLRRGELACPPSDLITQPVRAQPVRLVHIRGCLRLGEFRVVVGEPAFHLHELRRRKRYQ